MDKEITTANFTQKTIIAVMITITITTMIIIKITTLRISLKIIRIPLGTVVLM